MYNILLTYVFLAPLIGMFLVEHGAYSYSSGEFGYINGASLIYLTNVVIFLIFYKICNKIKYFSFTYSNFSTYNKKLNKLYLRILIIIILFIIIFLFFFNSYQVLSGKVQKGVFRSETVGSRGLGFLIYIITKFIIPSILAYFVIIYKNKIKTNKIMKLKLLSLFVLSSFFGFLWGFKSSAVIILVPALIFYLWDKDLKSYILIFFISFIIIIFSAIFFDNSIANDYNLSIFKFLFYRLTTIEGDTFWKVWDLISSGKINQSEIKLRNAILNFFGNNIFKLITNENILDPYIKIKYSFSSYLTYIVTNDIFSSTSGINNVTGTVASEGLIYFGFPFMYLYTIFAAFITSLNYKIIKFSVLKNKPKIGAISSSFFVFCTWSWLKGGDITSVFHISNIIGIIFTYFLLIFIEKVVLFKKRS